MNKFCILLILILIGCSSSSENALSINALFSDNMIVQQNAKLNIWGKAPQGSLIHVSSSWGGEATTTTTPDGKWILTIATPEVDHKPHQLMVSCENETIKIQNILLGEVWLASGQSNMEMPLKGFIDCI